MADQLSLSLNPSLPRLPAAMRPMLAVPAGEPFDSPDHLFEPTWGGRRALAFVEPAGGDLRPRLRLLDEQGRDLAGLVPELTTLPDRIDAESAIVDGELVVVDRAGRCDVLALGNRMRGRPGPPVAFLAFDLVYLDGRPLLSTPLARRRDMLRRALRPGDEIVPVPAIAVEGRALHAAAVEAGIAGVTARVRRSPYLPGVRSRLWRFVGRAVMGGPVDPDAPASAAEPGDDALVLAVSRSSWVLALMQRLPLDDSD
jgi:bifunctional non-homologous end joining protein LigD